MSSTRIGLGCVTFGREITAAEAFPILDFAVEKGIRFLDAAEAYGQGASERVLGEWLRTRGARAAVTLQTKVSFDFSSAGVARAVAASLERLQTDSVDYVLLHSRKAEYPLEESLGALAELVSKGLVRRIGVSNFSLADLQGANAICGANGWPALGSFQPPYSMVAREIEGACLDYCEEAGIVVNSYSPLGAGFLTGKYAAGGVVPAGSRFDVIPGHQGIYFREENFQLVERLRELSARTGYTMARLAMAWVFANRQVPIVLAGARTMEQVKNALEAAETDWDAAWNAVLSD